MIKILINYLKKYFSAIKLRCPAAAIKTAVMLSFLVMLIASGCEGFSQGLADRVSDNNGPETTESSMDQTEINSDVSGADNEVTDNSVETETGEKDNQTTTGTGSDAGTRDRPNNDKVSEPGETVPLESPEDALNSYRNLFKKGLDFFEKKDYAVAEYCFNRIKDDYLILEDHVLYYIAKSQLLQNKFETAESNYLKLKNNFEDSIFSEKAYLEYADLFFIKSDYSNAGINYKKYLEKFPETELTAYSRFQLAVCQEKNGKINDAFENYKFIWLESPESEYAGNAWQAIEKIAATNGLEPFVPSNDQIYSRGEKFFSIYWYESAISEFKNILENIKKEPESADSGTLEAKTLFKTGMSYFNLRDYSTSTDYLQSCFDKYPSGIYADDSLYFLGRASSSLNNDSGALSYYDKCAGSFAGSNYADDALYRAGRIHFLDGDLDKASQYYQRVINEYPGGDRISDAFWELGWIQYRKGNYSDSANTFKSMKNRFSSGQLAEKAMFWQAKSFEKTGLTPEAATLYKNILSLNSYSYYTFASIRALEKLGVSVSNSEINKEASPLNEDIGTILPEVFDSLLVPVYVSENSDDASEDPIKFSHFDKAKELLYLELSNSASTEIEAAKPELEKDNYSILQVATLYYMAKDYINSEKVISQYYSKLKTGLTGPYLDYFYYLIYPYGYKELVDKYSGQFGVDPMFALAVIREESRFNPQAGSYAGAQGLMQIMPATGKSIAGSIGVKNFSNEMLLDPETSIMMGCYYLGKQLENFNQNEYYACGAYNGGPGAMSRWVTDNGSKEIDEFIEYVTYEETRNYIKKVMASYYFYKILYE